MQRNEHFGRGRRVQLNKSDDAGRNERRPKFGEEFDKRRSSRPEKTEGSRAISQAEAKKKNK